MAHVLLNPDAQRQVLALPRPIRARLDRIILRLRNWPNVSGAKPLSGELAGKFRIRTGDFRIQFSVADDTVTIERVGHRDRFYD